MTGWRSHVEREERRYLEGLERLRADVAAPPDARQKQLVRVANAACGAGLALLMAERGAEARGWFLRAAERYRESYADAPPGSWGRLIGAMKMRLLAGDRVGAIDDARWSLGEVPTEAESPIGRYAAALARLLLGEDAEAGRLARTLRAEPDGGFPRAVADALAGLAEGDAMLYRNGVERTLRSFETRDAYLEDVPVADTVLVLELLAEPRGIAARPSSPLLPGSPGAGARRTLEERDER